MKSKYAEMRIFHRTILIPMVTLEQNQLIKRIQTFLLASYKAPANSAIDQHVKDWLEHPLLKQFIFANNQVVVIDHSIGGYLYVSDSIIDVLGHPKKELLEKGLAFSFGLFHPADLAVLAPVFEKVTSIAQQLPAGERPFFWFNYSFRYKRDNVFRLLYQQNIPLAFNETGVPYLVIALLSDITNYSKSDGVNYVASINKPGEPIRQLLSSRLVVKNNPFSERENEIVILLANGLDTNQIAEKLIISEGTVRKHRQNILEKTGAKNSVHLVRMAVANGWV